jgi:SAM-dependent methyltransferase
VAARVGLEITDLLWCFDADGRRAEVDRERVIERLTERGQRRAIRIVSGLPSVEGVLDAEAVDALGIRVHCELQRLGEELQFGRRVVALLGSLIGDLHPSQEAPVRIVDIGCGLGFVIRWLAATRALGRFVQLVGVDLNPVLVGEASRLAAVEDLSCRFVCGNAFAPGAVIEDGSRTIVISSGVLHHLPAAELPAFFAEQARLRVAAFAHWDIAPCRWSTIGAWVFHQARMREPVSRHDGVLSARRAHSAAVLEVAARSAAPTYDPHVREGTRWHPRALDVLRPVVGIHPR